MTPAEFIKSAEYDKEGQYIWGVDEKQGLQMIANVRGWGAIQHLFKSEEEAAKFQDELGEFIAAAINEKIDKEK